jgi:hypothetical protein
LAGWVAFLVALISSQALGYQLPARVPRATIFEGQCRALSTECK